MTIGVFLVTARFEPKNNCPRTKSSSQATENTPAGGEVAKLKPQGATRPLRSRAAANFVSISFFSKAIIIYLL